MRSSGTAKKLCEVLCYIVEDSDYRNCRSRRNRASGGFVVKADVAANDRDVKSVRRVTQAINSFNELPHDFRAFRIAIIQAVRDPRRAGSLRRLRCALPHIRLDTVPRYGSSAHARGLESTFSASPRLVPLIRRTAASPPGPTTVLLRTIESYWRKIHRREHTFGLASSARRAAGGAGVDARSVFEGCFTLGDRGIRRGDHRLAPHRSMPAREYRLPARLSRPLATVPRRGSGQPLSHSDSIS